MIPDLDIYRSTQVLVNRHERDAPIKAVMKADKLLAGFLCVTPTPSNHAARQPKPEYEMVGIVAAI